MEGEIALLDGQDLYLRLKDDWYDIKSITNTLADVEWFGLEDQKVLDGPVDDPFMFTKNITTGFVQVVEGYNLPPHTDNILASQIDHPSEFYSQWLLKTGNRNCAIMIPVEGDFKNTYTVLYDKDHNELTRFTLEDGPVLYPTNGDILHGVDNTNKGPRITYQYSFEEDYETIRDQIFTVELAKV